MKTIDNGIVLFLMPAQARCRIIVSSLFCFNIIYPRYCCMYVCMCASMNDCYVWESVWLSNVRDGREQCKWRPGDRLIGDGEFWFDFSCEKKIIFSATTQYSCVYVCMYVCTYVFVNVQPEEYKYRIICMHAWYLYVYVFLYVYVCVIVSLERSIA